MKIFREKSKRELQDERSYLVTLKEVVGQYDCHLCGTRYEICSCVNKK